MNALANDQLDRLRDMLGGTGITFGQWVGTTPAKERRRAGGPLRGLVPPGIPGRPPQAAGRGPGRGPGRAAPGPAEECCSEEDIQTRKPRILLTNFRQLEVLTTRLPDVELFAEAPLKYLVFDEAHTYAGATGPRSPALSDGCVPWPGRRPTRSLASARRPRSPIPPRRIKTTTRRPAASPPGSSAWMPNKVKLVGESYVSREWPNAAVQARCPDGDGMARLGRVLNAVTEPVKVAVIKGVVEELTGQAFEPGETGGSRCSTTSSPTSTSIQRLRSSSNPKRLNEAAWQTSQRLAMGRLPEGDRANAELLAYLVLGAAAQKSGESLLRPKVHFFLRGLDEMVVALDGTETAPQDEAVPVARRRQGAARRSARRRLLPGADVPKLRPALLREVVQGSRILRRVPRTSSGASSTATPRRTTTAATTRIGPHRRPRPALGLVLTNRLLEEADGGPSTKSARWPRAWFCRQCGAMHRESVAPLPGRRLRPQGAAAAADGVSVLAVVPARRAVRLRSRSADGTSSRPARSRPSRSPTFTSSPRR